MLKAFQPFKDFSVRVKIHNLYFRSALTNLLFLFDTSSKIKTKTQKKNAQNYPEISPFENSFKQILFSKRIKQTIFF